MVIDNMDKRRRSRRQSHGRQSEACGHEPHDRTPHNRTPSPAPGDDVQSNDDQGDLQLGHDEPGDSGDHGDRAPSPVFCGWSLVSEQCCSHVESVYDH